MLRLRLARRFTLLVVPGLLLANTSRSVADDWQDPTVIGRNSSRRTPRRCPTPGNYFWCPPLTNGHLDLSAVGL